MSIPEPTWAQLSPSAREALLRVARELAEKKHSGIIEVHCTTGHVRFVRFATEWRPNEARVSVPSQPRSSTATEEPR